MNHLYLCSYGFESETATKRLLFAMKSEFIAYTGLDLPNHYFAEKKMFLVSLPEHCVREKMTDNLINIFGFQRENLRFSEEGYPGDFRPDYVYVTAGNTFDVLDYMRAEGIFFYAEKMVREEGASYIGASAGASLAGDDIFFVRDFDSPRGHGYEYDYGGFRFVEGAIFPHFENEELIDYLTHEHYTRARYDCFTSVGNQTVVIFSHKADVNRWKELGRYSI